MNETVIGILALIVEFILFFGLFYLGKKKLNFGIIMIIAMILGAVLGIVFKGNLTYAALPGQIYVRVISSLVIPLVSITIITSISQMSSLKKMRNIGVKAIALLVSFTIVSSIITLALSFLFGIGNGMEVLLDETYQAKEIPPLTDVIKGFFPNNIFSSMAEGNIIPIILFSLFIGVGILAVGNYKKEDIEPLEKVLNGLNKVIFWMVGVVVDFTPFAVLSLIAAAVSKSQFSAIIPLLVVLVVAYLACIIVTFVVGSVYLIVNGLSPVPFFKKFWPAILVAFTSQSSMGTLPISMDILTEKLGVSENISSFVTPLGATIGMPGCAGVWPTLLAVMCIRALDIPFSGGQYILMIVLTGLISIGTAGVPGTATITATTLFVSLGLPIEIIVILNPISSIVDMARTACNVTTAAISTTVVAKSENELNTSVYNEKKIEAIIAK